MSSPEHVTYVFHGVDEPRLKDALKAFIAEISDPATADLNTTRLDGQNLQQGEIEASAMALPFLADNRLVLVENITASSNAKDILEALPETLTMLPGSTQLVFVEIGLTPGTDSASAQKRLRARKTGLKKLVNIVEEDPRGRVHAFGMPNNPAAWIMARAEHYAAQIEGTAAQELASRIGENLVLADMEIVKLATYTGGQRAITKTDVETLTPYTPEANIFNMVDALGQRRGDVALDLLRSLLEDGDEPLRVFGMIVRQYRLLLLMKEQMERGLSVRSAGKAIDVHPYVAEKLGSQTVRYNLPTLERIYRYLLEFDLAMKGQSLAPIDDDRTPLRNMDPALALETLVTILAGRG